MKKKLLVIFIAFSLINCQKLPLKSKINFQDWRNDSCGCLNKRSQIVDTLLKYRKDFYKMDTIKFIELLGDSNNKKNKNKRFLLYYITPGPCCNFGDSSGIGMIVEYNRKGKVKYINKVMYD